MKRKQKSAIKLVHEIRDGLHRIVIIGEDQNCAGDWVPQNEVAIDTAGKLFAICGESSLPQGIFSAKVHPHQVLS